MSEIKPASRVESHQRKLVDCFKSSLILMFWRYEADLKYPPTAVGGITETKPELGLRLDLKYPPTTVCGISTFEQIRPKLDMRSVPPAVAGGSLIRF
jgi:hypothetical protein